MQKHLVLILAILLFAGCNTKSTEETANIDNPKINPNSAIYEVAVQQGITHQEVLDSLKSVAVGMNFAASAHFEIDKSMRLRDIEPQGIKEVYTYCHLGMGANILLDHPEFLVFAPCRIAVYEKPDANNIMQLYLGLDRPTFDLKSIKNPTERAQKSAQQLEDGLIELMHRASEGDF